ncbi:ead/Ea22-like family protein [Raoultella planticola]|nr:ead/Ea22-like family protein [Raoultella planticola]
MTDITELAQSLKAAAEKATPGPWGVARDGKTLVSNQSHPIATVSDAMHRMLADGSTGKDAEFIALANPANVKRLVEALEKAQRHANLTEAERQAYLGLISKRDERIAELEEAEQKLCAANVTLDARAELAERRLAELESRTVTVKLPEPFKLAKSSSGLTYYYADEVNEALTAHGIKWEAE